MQHLIDRSRQLGGVQQDIKQEERDHQKAEQKRQRFEDADDAVEQKLGDALGIGGGVRPQRLADPLDLLVDQCADVVRRILVELVDQTD